MKAIAQRAYGSPDAVLELQDVDQPVVGEDEVLLRVHAASVHPDVWHVVSGLPYFLRLGGAGLLKPKNRVPGTDAAGRVEAVGKNVTHFRPGDEVFGEIVRGHQWHNGGAFAEYASAPEDQLALKPANITLEQAAAVPTSALIAPAGGSLSGACTTRTEGSDQWRGGRCGHVRGAACQGVPSGRDRRGQHKLEMLRSIGADQVIDYTREDFTRRGERYDLIVDVPGNHSVTGCIRALTPEGTYVLIGHDQFADRAGRWIGSLRRILKLSLLSPFVRQQISPPIAKDTEEPLVVLKELIEAGKITPVVDRTYPLSEVPEALRYLREGTARGKVAITI